MNLERALPFWLWLGRVTQVSPLLVERNGSPGPTAAGKLNDFTGAVANTTEVLGVTIAGRRLVWRIS